MKITFCCEDDKCSHESAGHGVEQFAKPLNNKAEIGAAFESILESGWPTCCDCEEEMTWSIK